MSAFPTLDWKLFADEIFHQALQEWNNNKILGYYSFPWFGPQQDQADETPAKPKPTTCIEVLKQHEENVEKALDAMPQIEKLIIYRTLNAQGLRTAGIDREIYKEAQKELKANG